MSFDLETAIGKLSATGGALHVTAAMVGGALVPNTYVRPKAGKPITVTADPELIFDGFVFQAGSGNVTLDGLTIRVSKAQGCAVVAQEAYSVHVLGCAIHGTAVGDGLGIRFLNSTNCTAVGNEIANVGSGIANGGCTNILIDGNSFHDLQVDGVQSQGSQPVSITNNHFTRFFPQPGDHSDAIQFQTSNQTKPMGNITITGNVYERGDGVPAGVQGVFMGDEAAVGYGVVTILGNAILGGVYHGITLERAAQAEIGDNLVASYTDTITKASSIVSWIEDQACVQGSVHDNVATAYNPAAEPGHPETMTKLTHVGNTTIPPVAPGDAAALLAQWKTRHNTPTPPPPVTTQPADPLRAALAQIAAIAKAALA